MARVLSINLANTIELVFKIQKLECEVDLKYSNILVKAFKETENIRELVFLKDTVEAIRRMAYKSQENPILHNT